MNVPLRDSWRIAMPTPPKGAKWVEPPKVVTRLPSVAMMEPSSTPTMPM